MIYRFCWHRYATPTTYKLRQPSHFSTLFCWRHVVSAATVSPAGSAVMSSLGISFIIFQYCHQIQWRLVGACALHSNNFIHKYLYIHYLYQNQYQTKNGLYELFKLLIYSLAHCKSSIVNIEIVKYLFVCNL